MAGGSGLGGGLYFHGMEQFAPVIGLKVHDLAAYQPESACLIIVLADRVKSQDCAKSPVRVLLDRRKHVRAPGVVGILPWSAGRSEDIEPPAGCRPDRMDGTGVLDQEGTGSAGPVAFELALQHPQMGAPFRDYLKSLRL